MKITGKLGHFEETLHWAVVVAQVVMIRKVLGSTLHEVMGLFLFIT